MSDARRPPTLPFSEAFWEMGERGELGLQVCADCSRAIFPPRVICPSCWGANLRWDRASGLGTVYTYSIVHRPPHATFPMDAPYVVALIDLDEGPRMMSNVVGCDPDQVSIGMRVRVSWDGAETKLPYFRPA